MLFKNMKLVLIVSILLLTVFGNSLMAACGSCSNSCCKPACNTEKSFNAIREQIAVLEKIDPRKNVETGARAVQNILCEMSRINFSEQGKEYARLSEGYFRKTLANFGKANAGFYQQPCFVTYPFALHFFGKLYRTELNQNNPFKNSLWFYITRQIGWAKAAVSSLSGFQADPQQLAMQKSMVYKRVSNHLKVVAKFVDGLDNVTEAQQKQVDILFQRCQFAYSQKDYAGFDKNLALLEAALLRLKGIITADNC
ncbi:MAG: hypothetical protein ACOYXC_05250 [Candidatus Rifleibacteriota bacterium]